MAEKAVVPRFLRGTDGELDDVPRKRGVFRATERQNSNVSRFLRVNRRENRDVPRKRRVFSVTGRQNSNVPRFLRVNRRENRDVPRKQSMAVVKGVLQARLHGSFPGTWLTFASIALQAESKGCHRVTNYVRSDRQDTIGREEQCGRLAKWRSPGSFCV